MHGSLLGAQGSNGQQLASWQAWAKLLRGLPPPLQAGPAAAWAAPDNHQAKAGLPAFGVVEPVQMVA